MMGPRNRPMGTGNRGPQKPKNLKDVPRYLRQLIGGFFSRLFYIVGLVWETSPFVLILMAFFCLCDGFLPVIGAYISKELLNEISALLHTEEAINAIVQTAVGE